MPTQPMARVMMAQVSGTDVPERIEVVECARGWIGTPYRRRASMMGAGADCLGLLRGVWRELCGPEPLSVPVYSDDWLEMHQKDTLLYALQSVLLTAEGSVPRAGSVLAFRFGRNRTCKHVGILTANGAHPRFVHSYCRYGVVETSLDRVWRRRIAAIFDFPPRST